MECRIDSSIERLREATLGLLGFLDEPASREFDTLTRVATRLLGCKIAMVSLIDERSHHVLSIVGLPGAALPRRDSFCARVVDAGEPLIVEDTALDPRFSANPFVVGAPHIRFYAGLPLLARTSEADARRIPVGTLCIVDDRPRRLDEAGLAMLQDLAHLAEALIEARSAAKEVGLLMEESQAAIETLRREQRLFKQAERMALLGSWRSTLADDRLVWSDQVYAIHELEPGVPPSIEEALSFYPPESRDLVTGAISRAVETGEPFDFETDFVTARGNRRRVRSVGEIECVAGRPVALVGVFQDVSCTHEMQETLRSIASTDELTRIANRAECNRMIDERMASARRDGTDLALLLIDLDGFKAVNDRCGHLAGDDLLRRIGQRLRLPYLEDAFAARLGGDEFVVLLSTPEDCARHQTIVDRLLADLREAIPHADGTIPVSGTIGISWLDEAATTRSDFLQRADVALYAAKKRQRGTAMTYPVAPQTVALAG